MKLICNKNDLLVTINIVSKAVSTKTTMPILECILLNAQDNSYILTSNDMEMAIKTSPVYANVIEEGAVAIEAKMLYEIVRKLSDDDIYIESNNRNIITIKCGKSKFTLMGQPADEFPNLPEIQREQEFILKQVDFKNMIRQTNFSVAVTDDRTAYIGQLIEIKDGFFRLVSVDGYRVSYRKTSINYTSEAIRVIVPGKTLNEISKILLTEQDSNVSIFIMSNQVLFDLGNCIVLSRVLTGDFINYNNMFTNDYDTFVKLDKTQFLMSIERAALLSRENKRVAVKMKIFDNLMIMNSNTELGAVHEELPVDMQGNELEISFNPKFIIDALKAIDEEQITIQFTTSLSPCIIRVMDSDEYNYLILPLKI